MPVLSSANRAEKTGQCLSVQQDMCHSILPHDSDPDLSCNKTTIKQQLNKINTVRFLDSHNSK